MLGEGCSELKEEIKGHKFGLGHKYPHLFVIPQCVPPKFYLVWVSFWALFYICNLSLEVYYNVDEGAKYFIYLTRWSYLWQSAVVFLDFIVTVYVHLRRKDILNGEQDGTTWYIKLLWVFFNVNNVTAILVTTLYYALLNPEFTHRSVNTHLLNSVYTLLTFIFCAKPVNLFHFYQPVVYAICYSLFSVIWHYTGNDPVYDILDWEQPGPTVRTVLIVTLVGGPLLHVLVFALYTFRNWFSEQCGCTGNTQRPSEKKPQRELTSRDVELQLPHKANSVHPC